MRHTPAPWFIDNDLYGLHVEHRNFIDGKAFNYRVVCSITDIEEAEHNARLIAAAPELLEALENLVEMFAAGDGSPEYHRHEPPEMKDARTAIAKATDGE
jgi:hypothetical protein